MKLFNALVLIFYTLLILLMGVVFISVSLGIITMENVSEVVSLFYNDANLRLSLGISGLLLIIIGLGVVQLALTKIQREKTIAFDSPHGQVSISLAAIEDFIRRLFRMSPDIKELRPVCIATRKGIEILNKVALWQDAKIPEVTERIQSTIKFRLKQILGIEESIIVKVHVVKILPKDIHKSKETKETEIEVPYQYRD
jgi:uncharacterized alkaline shock family protein YloU